MLASNVTALALALAFSIQFAQSSRKRIGDAITIRAHLMGPSTEDKLAAVDKYMKARIPELGVQDADKVDLASVWQVLDPNATIEILYPRTEGVYTGMEEITTYLTTQSKVPINILERPSKPKEEADGSITSTCKLQLEGSFAVGIALKALGIPWKTPMNLKATFKFDKPESGLITSVTSTNAEIEKDEESK